MEAHIHLPELLEVTLYLVASPQPEAVVVEPEVKPHRAKQMVVG
jgi:hypothetical protein